MANLIRKSLSTIKNKGLRVFFIKILSKLIPSKNFPYRSWLKANEPNSGELIKLKKNIEGFLKRPKFTVLIFSNEKNKLDEDLSLKSLEKQIYLNWNLTSLKEGLEKLYEKENWGDYIVFLQSGDLLSPEALYEVAFAVNTNSESNLFYTDEDVYIGSLNNRFSPSLKPDWSPEYFESFNYLGNGIIIKNKLFKERFNLIKDIKPNNFGEVIFQIALENKASHVNKILYHNQKGKTVYTINPDLIKASLEKTGVLASVESTKFNNVFNISYQLKIHPKITVIIPTRDKVEVLKKCLDSIVMKTTYHNYEICVVNNQSEEKRTLDYFEEISKFDNLKIVDYNFPFSFSTLNNFAAKKSSAEYLLFLNNDTEIITPNWLEEMLAVAEKKGVGIVGAKLYYPNNTIQHAGAILGVGDFAGHVFVQKPRTDPGYFYRLITPQNYRAVTGACLLLKKELFEKVGGFEENLPIAFNDIDLCLKIYQMGYRVVWTPYAELYHYESLTRGLDTTSEKAKRLKKEGEFCREKWQKLLKEEDPYFNQAINLLS